MKNPITLPPDVQREIDANPTALFHSLKGHKMDTIPSNYPRPIPYPEDVKKRVRELYENGITKNKIGYHVGPVYINQHEYSLHFYNVANILAGGDPFASHCRNCRKCYCVM